MDWLLDPNVAYTLLVLTLLSITLAVLIPGTGAVEVMALVLTVLSGYTLLNLPMRLWALGLLGLGLLTFIWPIWVRRGQRFWIWISLAALVVGSAFLFALPGRLIAVHPAVLAANVLLLGGYFWFGVHRGLEALQAQPKVSHLEQLIGQIGETRTPVHHSGSVYVEGELWSARSTTPIPSGQRVRVIGRKGLTLLVEPAEASEPSTAQDA